MSAGRALAGLVLGALVSGCGSSETPSWIPLTNGQRSVAPANALGSHVRVEPDG